MINIKINKNEMLIMLKCDDIYKKNIYQIIPLVTYSDEELFKCDDNSFFKSINKDEDNYELIIIGQKILKTQLDNIKKIFFKTYHRDLNIIIFETDEIIDEQLIFSFNEQEIHLTGKYKGNNIFFKLYGDNWMEEFL